jgi:hypothetical protein
VIKTIEAVIDEKGIVHLLEPAPPGAVRRVLVTILDEAPAATSSESALLSEASLSEDWSRPEEDAAWAHVQPVP